MKKFIFLLIFIFITGCQSVTNSNLSNNSKSNLSQKMIIPLYLYNADIWNHISKFQNKEIVILNPSNGPGDEKDSNYEDLINKLNKNKNKPIGYVYTKWGDRNITEVKKDINRWLDFYPNIKGFFIDEASENIDDINYYKNLYDYIKSKGNYYIVLNPGVYPDEEYFNIADSIVVFEDEFYKLDSDVCKKNSDKSSLIVYDANESEMEDIIKNYKCKNVYVTDDNLPNPYDTVPSYFDEEIKLLK